MTWIALLLILLCTLGADCDDDCSAPLAVSEAAADASVQELCAAEGQTCQSVQSISLAWSDGYTVFFSPVRCAEDLAICRFSIWHEIGHVQVGESEALADCFASDRATDDEVDTAICYFETTTFGGGSGADTHGTGPERADRIRSCR